MAGQQVYKLPNAPKNVGGLQWQALFLGVTLLLITNIVATQFMAEQFGYQEGLGPYLMKIGETKFYAPYKWAIWYLQIDRPAIPESTRTVLMHTLFRVIGGGAVSVGIYAFIVFSRASNHHKEAQHLHGSARWAEREDIVAMGLLSDDPKKPAEGVYVGGWAHKGKTHYLRHNGPEHVICFAPSRSGKGVGLVLPTLLGGWTQSCIVYDIKGENYALTAGWREKHAKNKIYKFSPVEMLGGHHFNPLNEVRLWTNRDVSDAQNIAFMITHPAGDSDDHDHWVDSATSLLTGLILYVAYKAHKNKTTAGLPDLVKTLTQPGKSFENVLNEILEEGFDEEFKMKWRVNGELSPRHPVIAGEMQKMLDKEDKERSGVLSTASTFLQLYSDPIVSVNIQDSDFKVDNIVNDDVPATLYLVVPPSDKDRLRPLIRLILTQIINRLTEKMEFKDGRSVQTHKHRLLMLIDEFPTLGQMNVVVNSMGYTAGYGIKYYLIVQDAVQLKAVYGENELVFSGTHVRIAYAPNNQDTAELLSSMTGTMTIQHVERSYSGKRTAMSQDQVTTSVSTGQRPLMTADEITRLPGLKKDIKTGDVVEGGDMLIFVTGFPAVYGKQILYFKDPTFLARAKVPAPLPPVRPEEKKEDAVPVMKVAAGDKAFPEADASVAGGAFMDQGAIDAARADDVGTAVTTAAVQAKAASEPEKKPTHDPKKKLAIPAVQTMLAPRRPAETVAPEKPMITGDEEVIQVSPPKH